MTGRLGLLLLAQVTASAAWAQTGTPAGPGACSLPATAAVEPGKLRIPAGIGTVSVVVTGDTSRLGEWRRAPGDRSSVAEVAIEPKLEFGRTYSLKVAVERRPSSAELTSLRSWLAVRAAGAGPIAAPSLAREATRQLTPACSAGWQLPALDTLPASHRSRDSVRAQLVEQRAGSSRAETDLAAAIERAGQPDAVLLRLRRQAQDTAAATPRELRTLDQIIEATAADTAVDRLAAFVVRVERAKDLLAGWHARTPPRIRLTTVDSARASVAALRDLARILAESRLRVAETVRDSARITTRLATELLTAFGEAGFVTDTLRHTVTLPEPDAGKWRIGVGAHYTAPVRSSLLGYPGATNRIFPDVFVHWSPAGTGGRRPVTVDFGLALNTVGRRGTARDLFWRSSVLVGASVHPKGFVRIGAGVQLIRELAEDDHSRLRIPLYVAVSVAQFKLP